MSKLLKYISEYFLGTETIKLYRYERSHYREFVTDSNDLRKKLKESKIEEGLELFIGRFIPNLIDIGAIVNSLITKIPPYWLFVGEGTRLVNIILSNYDRKLKRLEMDSKYISSTLQEIADNLQIDKSQKEIH